MTAIGFVHPDGIPTLISDLVISGGKQGVLLPCRFQVSETDHTKTLATLCRKTVELSPPKTILGFSGSVHQIREVLSGISSEIKRLDTERPMRAVGDMINNYLIHRNSEKVSCVGFSPFPDGAGANVLMGLMKNSHSTENFNEIGVSGSGAEWLKGRIILGDKIISAVPNYGNLSYEKLVGLLGFINSCAMFTLGRDSQGQSFGGYFEARTSHPRGQSYPLGRWLHLGYCVFMHNGVPFFNQIAKQVFYDPYLREINVSFGSPTELKSVRWPIQTFFPGMDVYDGQAVSTDLQPPTRVTVYFDIINIRRDLHFTLDLREHQFLREIGENFWTLDENFMNKKLRLSLTDPVIQ